MSWAFKKSDDVSILVFRGSLSHDNTQEMKNVLMKYISDHDRVFFDFGAVTDMDNSFIEVFCTAFRISEKLGKRPVLLGLWETDRLGEYSFSPREHLHCPVIY
ncbi:MAG: anti-sigma factor antagonist [Nitrospirae bacterium]|nr:MAG: anti-sigma factor antagonist [Nitrospirota bacterium]